MRTFSRLRAYCAYSDQLERPRPRRDGAAAVGTAFHRAVEEWIQRGREGKAWSADLAPEAIRGWLRRLQESWAPPPGLELEVPMGLAAGPAPQYVPVVELEPHVYVPADLGVTTAAWAAASDEQRAQWQAGLVTAGRADLVAPPLRDVGVVWVDDIKTGQRYLGDPKLLRQLLAQGIAATLRARADGFIPGIYYARLGIFDRGDCEPIWRGSHEWDQAWDWVVAAAQMPAEPQPGAWCLSCWEKDACSAYPGREEARP